MDDCWFRLGDHGRYHASAFGLMNPAKYEYTCDCGKQFNLNHDNLGGKMICPYCDRRFTIPSDLQPVEGVSNAAAAASRSATNKKSPEAIRMKSLGIGLLMILGALAMAGVSYFSITQGRASRSLVFNPLVAFALLVFGIGYILRSIFGKRMEWD